MKLRVRPAGALLLAAGLSACDVPSGIPRWETTWITPGEGTTVSVAELLPPGLDVNDDTTAFVLALAPLNTAWQLSEVCPGCSPGAAPVKPAFVSNLTGTLALPAGVQSVDLEGGTIDIEFVNNFEFDPIRPGVASDSGSVTITVRSGATELTSVVVRGEDAAFGPGDTIARTLTFAPASVVDDIVVEFTIDSPQGDATTFSSTDGFEADIATGGLEVSEGVVSVTGQQIEAVETPLDLSDVDLDQVREGAIFLDIVNPFGVTGTLNLMIETGDGGVIEETEALSAADSSTIVLDFDQTELEQMIGQENTMRIEATVNGGSVTVRPDMVMGIETRLRITVEMDFAGNDDEDEG